MSYAFVQDVAASWERYAAFAAALSGPLPPGLILHVAGPTDEGFRIIDVWESEDAWLRFRAERLPDAAGAGGPPLPALVFRALRPAHLVRGACDDPAPAGPAGGTRTEEGAPWPEG